MATLSSDGSSSGPGWIATFQAQVLHTQALCRSVQTSAVHEAEYAKLLSEALQRLLYERMRLGKGDNTMPEQWTKDAVSSLSRLASRLDPDNSSRSQPPSSRPALTWQLENDEVIKFVGLLDGLRGDIRRAHLNKMNDDSHMPSPAPPVLYISKLNQSRNRLFPPPQLGPWVDVGRLSRWLLHCGKHHKAHCQFSAQSEEIFKYRPRRLIDVQRMCLVPSVPGQQMRYAALSYVWGAGPAFKTLRRNINLLQQERSLSADEQGRKLAQLPRTIRDVMELTRRLGEQFLWVDSLCIVQDDEQDRNEELERMGSIYANAYLTIVASGGTAFTGLRGIEETTPPMRRVSRAPEYLLHGQDYRLRRALQESHRKLQSSPWNHRAWTFQEQIFSRRLLVLDHTSVAWECHCAVWLEGMEPTEGGCQNNKDMVAQGFSFSVQPSLKDYARHVAEFNRRELSFPEDALDAFRGILRTLTSTAFAGGFICGLPVMFFDAALLWYNQLPLERRRARRKDSVYGSASASLLPPSWAWAAWAGTVTFPDCEYSPVGPRDADVRPLVHWKLWDNEKENWEPISSARGDQPLEALAELEQSAAASAGEHNSRSGCVNPPLFSTEGRSHLLFAHASRAYFFIMEVFGEVQLLLSDGSDGCAGMLTSCEVLDQDINASDYVCEVVAVSTSIINDEKVYNVIWIEWENDVGYRKGVGRVLQSAWETQDSQRIDLFLG